MVHLKKANILEYVPAETLISNSWIKALKHRLKHTQIAEEKNIHKGNQENDMSKV